MTEVIVGQQLRTLRGEEKQADLVGRLRATGVEALQITQQRYSDWEGGARPPYEALLALADFWGVELRWLMTGEGPRERGAPEDDTIRLEAVKKVLGADLNQLRREYENQLRPQIEQRIAEARRLGLVPETHPTQDGDPVDDGERPEEPRGPGSGDPRSASGR